MEKLFANIIDIQECKQPDHITNQSRIQAIIFLDTKIQGTSAFEKSVMLKKVEEMRKKRISSSKVNPSVHLKCQVGDTGDPRLTTISLVTVQNYGAELRQLQAMPKVMCGHCSTLTVT